MFDNDVTRENRTSPGGLPVYGKIAALAAGRPESFVDGYAAMADWDGEQPTPGTLFDATAEDFATYLVDRVERAAPRRIIWHFERPTQWERWLARRLAEVGGSLQSFPTALSVTPGVRVVTPWEHREGAFGVLRELAAGWRPAEDSTCVKLTIERSFWMTGPVLLLAAAPGSGTTSPPEWLGSSWRDVRLGSGRFDHWTMVGATVGASVPAAPTGEVELLGEFGVRIGIDRVSGAQHPIIANPFGALGFNCGVYAGGHWWAIDPLRGRVMSAPPAVVPRGVWIGGARGEHDELVLASAEQSILVLDPTTREVARRFPARVWPSVRAGTDECSQIAVGEGWIATIALRGGTASFYDADGRALGTKQLAPGKGLGDAITAFAGAGRYLGVASASGMIRTFQVTIDPACVAPGPDGELAH
jgi:hypothetical protein